MAHQLMILRLVNLIRLERWRSWWGVLKDMFGSAYFVSWTESTHP